MGTAVNKDGRSPTPVQVEPGGVCTRPDRNEGWCTGRRATTPGIQRRHEGPARDTSTQGRARPAASLPTGPPHDD